MPDGFNIHRVMVNTRAQRNAADARQSDQTHSHAVTKPSAGAGYVRVNKVVRVHTSKERPEEDTGPVFLSRNSVRMEICGPGRI